MRRKTFAYFAIAVDGLFHVSGFGAQDVLVAVEGVTAELDLYDG